MPAPPGRGPLAWMRRLFGRADAVLPPAPEADPPVPMAPIAISLEGHAEPDIVPQTAVTYASMRVVGTLTPPRKTLENDAVVPFAPHGDKVAEARRALLERARSLGHRVTREPDLRLSVGSVVYRAVEQRGQVHVFRLPAVPGELRLISRSGVPKRMYPDTNDDRRLGVFVTEIVIADHARQLRLGAEDDRLTQGWWALERAGDSPRRWTDGDALLPVTLDEFAGEVTVEVTVVHTMASWVEE